MTDQHWQRLNELFDGAIERGPGGWVPFLRDACGADSELFGEVERLVQAHFEAGDFIERLPVADVCQALQSLRQGAVIGQRIGPYRILREIGRGGMGTVYLAERADDQYRKQVAVKLINPGMDSDTILRQFFNERQILASLEHPNIARLLDGGTTEENDPYFVMDYIEGWPIDQFCEKRRLNVTQRILLFQRVCAAVSYAHSALVVHRDIKPSNILVTEQGVLKLLDFGIAKILDLGASTGPASTLTALQVMTPEYASPEQVRGVACTTLSDVYSLGVVLFELLTGRFPYEFPSRTPREMAEVILRTDPGRPSEAVMNPPPDASDHPSTRFSVWIPEGSPERHRRRLRGDLDNIVLTALRKEPDRRYNSVEQLSQDLDRHLAGLPVRARPDTFVYRSTKFLSRNRLAVSAAALVFLSLAGGIVGTSWQARRAEAEKAVAQDAQARAERRFQDVRKLAHSVLYDYHDAIKDLPGSTPVRLRMVRDALEYLDSLAGEANDDVSLQLELATAYERIGDVQGGTMFANLGDTTGAIQSLRKALSIRASLAASYPGSRPVREGLAWSHYKLGSLLWETGRVGEALQQCREALDLFGRLSTEDPGDPDLLLDLGSAHDRVGMILIDDGNLPEAVSHFREQLRLLESCPAPERESPKLRRAFSVAYEHLGSALLQAGKLEEALSQNTEALAIRSGLVASYPLNADYRRTLLVSYYNNGEILARMGRRREALESYRKDLALAVQLSAADPQNEEYRGDRAYALIRVGDMLAALGDYPQALEDYRTSAASRARDVESDPGNLWKRCSLLEAHAKIAKAAARAGEVETALNACDQSVKSLKEMVIDPSNAAFRSFFATTFNDLGEAYAALAAKAPSGGEEGLERRRDACEMYGRSAEIWDDLSNRNLMAAIDRETADAVRREVQRCGTAAARIRR